MTDDLRATTDDASKTPAHAGPPPAQPPAPVENSTGAGARSIGTDIAQILKTVKIPERRSAAEPKPTDSPSLAKLTPPTLDEEALASSAPLTKATLIQTQAIQSNSPLPAVHTFKDDVQHIVREKKVSLIRAASMEQDRRDRAPEPISPGASQRTQRSTAILFASLLLFAIGSAALFGVYFVMSNSSGSARAPLDASLVFAEQSAALTVNNTSPLTLREIIARARENSTGTIGSITHIVPTLSTTSPDGTATTQPISTSRFFRALGTHAPDELTDALDRTFFFGIHTVDTNAPFLVIPVLSYEHAFAGMLAWERTMNADLAPIFPAVSDTTLDENNIPTRRVFEDSILRNYDIRILRNDRGTSVLYYSFPSPSLLIIAESPYTFTELLSRLQAAHRL